ncbi:MAG: PQQ-like beta-propeller repeat protein [Verrucomicrobia bacterium]|nr:PQQ-like beta-propeller repeat protein [Verrucomicrobiota bacterium]
MKISTKTSWAVAALIFLTANSLRSEDWTQYRGPDHNGISKEDIKLEWPASGPEVLWKVPVNKGFSTFTIADAKAYTLELRDINGAATEVCVARNAESGEIIWTTPVGNAKYDGGGDTGARGNRGGDGPRSTPSIVDGKVYVLSAYLKLFCINAASGDIVWRKDLVEEFGGKVIGWQNAASPLVEDELIIVNSNADEESIIAFNKDDGTLVWRTTNEKLTHASPIAATILGKRQVIFFTQFGLVALDPTNGSELWRYKFPYNVSTAASPVVAGDIVYCTAGYGVGSAAIQLSNENGRFTVKELWRNPGNKLCNQWSTPVYYDGYLYGIYGHKEFGDAPLKCLDLATGEEIWSKDGFGPGGVLLVEEHIIVLSDAGTLFVVEATPEGYEEVSKFEAIDGKCWNTPSICNGKIYARSTEEGVCIDVSQE